MKAFYEAEYLIEGYPGLAKEMKERFETELLRIAPEYRGRAKVTIHRGRLRLRILGRGDHEMAVQIVGLVEARIGL